MTVQQLFNSMTFDEVLAALRNTHRNDRSIQNVAGYKEAFDVLCNLKPKGEGGEVTFDVTPREEWFAPHSLPMLANGAEGDHWENIVQKTVIRPDDNPFTDAELAGAILWGATFYGFTRHRKWEPSFVTYSKFGEQAKRLEHRLYIPYLRDKKKIRKLKKELMQHGIVFTMEEWDAIHCRQRHQNRSKRKRFHRIEHRIEQLEKLDKRQHLINRLNVAIGHNRTPASEILNAKSITEEWFESHSYGKQSRLNYIIDLLENYCPDFDKICRTGDNTLIICYTADSTPLSSNEKTTLRNFLASHFSQGFNCQLHFATDPAIPNELALQFIGIKTTI